MIGRPVDRTRQLLRDEIQAALEAQVKMGGRLSEAEIQVVDNGTLSISIPTSVGTRTVYEAIIRRKT